MSEVAMPGGVQMLPLIVGSANDNQVVPVEPSTSTSTSDHIEEAELIVDPPEEAETTKAAQPSSAANH